MKHSLMAALAAFGVAYILADNIPAAQADGHTEKYVLIVSNHGDLPTAHDFDSLQTCEAARDWKGLSGVRRECLRK